MKTDDLWIGGLKLRADNPTVALVQDALSTALDSNDAVDDGDFRLLVNQQRYLYAARYLRHIGRVGDVLLLRDTWQKPTVPWASLSRRDRATYALGMLLRAGPP